MILADDRYEQKDIPYAAENETLPYSLATMSSRKGGAFLLATIIVAVGLWTYQRIFSQPELTQIDASINLSRVSPAFTDPDELRRLIDQYESRTGEFTTPSDYLSLGALYLEAGRTTGDLSRYQAAEDAYRKADELRPQDVSGRLGIARAQFAVHDFIAALATVEGVLEQAPERIDALLIRSDVRLAIGDLEAAAAALSVVASQFPDSPAVQVRQAELAWLYGDHDTARTLAQAAVTGSASLIPRGRSWYENFAARIFFDTGDLLAARRFSDLAAEHDPESILTNLMQGQITAAEGDVDGAISFYQRAAEVVPEPSTLASLGDLYILLGDDEAADRQFDTAETIIDLARSLGTAYDRQAVYFLADHDRNPGLAIELAQAELAFRSDPQAHDAYAWALHTAERYDEARLASDRALANGFRSAPALFHAGMISAALGEVDRAIGELMQALAINDQFDPIQAEAARSMLSSLRG